MIDLIKTQWIGIITLVLVVFGLATGGAPVVENGLGSNETTTISNPHVFTNTVTLSSTLAARELSEAITGVNTLTAIESGSVFYVSGAAATTTLPAVATATGTVFTFVVSDSVTGDITILSAEGDNLEGAVDVNSTIATVDAADTVRFAGAAENIGDIVTVRSNGQKWFVIGTALNAAGIAAAG